MNKYELIKLLLDDDNRKNDKLYEKDTFLEVGENYLFRCVTMIYSGKIKEIRNNEILLTDAAWIADTGRFADALKSCEFVEVEPYYNEVVIHRSVITDYSKIKILPEEQK